LVLRLQAYLSLFHTYPPTLTLYLSFSTTSALLKGLKHHKAWFSELAVQETPQKRDNNNYFGIKGIKSLS